MGDLVHSSGSLQVARVFAQGPFRFDLLSGKQPFEFLFFGIGPFSRLESGRNPARKPELRPGGIIW
jgi:hypothetical protein